jgi:hypothetical protein
VGRPDHSRQVEPSASSAAARDSHTNDLTDREVEVLRVLARGLSNLHTRAGAAVFAIEHGLVPAAADG